MSPLARFLRPLRSRPLAAEALERRCLLAGIVTATLSDAGELQLVGNAKNNVVEVRAVGDDLLVRGFDNTRINGQEEVVFTGGALLLQDLKAVLGKGHDQLTIADLVVPGNVRLGQGQVDTLFDAGNDKILLDHVLIGGDLAINAGAGADYVTLHEVAVAAATEIRGGSGNDKLKLIDSALADLTLLGGSGSDQATIDDTLVGIAANVQMGTGNDVLAILGDSILPSGTFLNGNSGRDRLTLDEEAALIQFTSVLSFEIRQVVYPM